MMRRMFSTETRSRANARSSLAGMQLRREHALQAQEAVDLAAAVKASRR